MVRGIGKGKGTMTRESQVVRGIGKGKEGTRNTRTDNNMKNPVPLIYEIKVPK